MSRSLDRTLTLTLTRALTLGHDPSRLRRVLLLLAICAIALNGCRDGGGSKDDTRDTGQATQDPDTSQVSDTSARPDTQLPLDASGEVWSPDTDVTEELPTGCEGITETRSAFPASGSTAGTQIHPQVASDGAGHVWLVYGQPDDQGEGGFDIMATKLSCTGHELEAFNVHPPSRENDTDPELAIGDDGNVLVVWTRDKSKVEPEDPANLDIMYTLLSPDGVNLVAPRPLETKRNDVPVTGNAWNASVTFQLETPYTVVGVRGDDTHNCFLAFVQAIEPDGQVIRDAVDLGVHQTACDASPRAAFVRAGDIGLKVAFVRTLTVDDDPVPMVGSVASVSGPLQSSAIDLIEGVKGETADIAALPDGRLLRAIGTLDGEIVVSDGQTRLTLGSPSATEFSPALSLSSDGQSAALFFFRSRQGAQADIVLQRLELGGGTLVAGEAVVVTEDEPAWAYGPAVTHVGGNVWFVAWPQGPNPGFTIYGRFVVLDD